MGACVTGDLYIPSQHDTTALAREYPLALITPANHYFLNSIFANTARQQQRAGAATLLIHPNDAAPRCIANARGAFFAVAEVSDRVRPGVVASSKGRWPGFSKGGATINATVDARDSDMGKRSCLPRQPCTRRQDVVMGCALSKPRLSNLQRWTRREGGPFF
jgi:anaerobic selenocysteine-containing dehydrogenase